MPPSISYDDGLADNPLFVEKRYSKSSTQPDHEKREKDVALLFAPTPPNSHSPKRRRSTSALDQAWFHDSSCEPNAKRQHVFDTSQLAPSSTCPQLPHHTDLMTRTNPHMNADNVATASVHCQEDAMPANTLYDSEAPNVLEAFKNATEHSYETSLSDDIMDEFDETTLDELLVDFYESPKADTLHKSGSARVSNDVFDITEAEEEALALLMDPPSHQEPPSSVVRAWCLDSRSEESRSEHQFDPELQYSSPRPGSNLTQTVLDDNLLDVEVNWEDVCKQGPARVETASWLESSNSATLSETKTSVIQQAMSSPETQISVSSTIHVPDYFIGQMLLKPFKTFFSLQEMLDTKEEMYQHQSEITFELFARVSYSSRENFQHQQHFLFRDLLKETPPFLNGTLLG